MIAAGLLTFLAVSGIMALWIWLSKLPDSDLALLETLSLWGGHY